MFVKFKTELSEKHGSIYSTITHIFNNETGVFDAVERDNINITINKENILDSYDKDLLLNSHTIVEFDKFHRVKNIINKPNYTYEYKINYPFYIELYDLIEYYNDDIQNIDAIDKLTKNFILNKHKIDTHSLKERTYNFVADKIKILIGYNFNNLGININVTSWYKDCYIPTAQDILDIYNILMVNKVNFDTVKALYGAVQEKIIASDRILVDGAYEVIYKNNVKVPFNDMVKHDNIINAIHDLRSVLPEKASVGYVVYNKHITVKYNDAAIDWIKSYRGTDFIKDINNILNGKKD